MKQSFAGLKATRTDRGPTARTRYLKESEVLPLFTMSMPVSQPPPQDLFDPSILTRLPYEPPNAFGSPDENLRLPKRMFEAESLKTLAPGTGKVRLLAQAGKFAELQTDDTGNPGRFLQ